jgi:hypothetical protein
VSSRALAQGLLWWLPNGVALGSTLYSMAAVRTSGDSWLDLLGMDVFALGEKP